MNVLYLVFTVLVYVHTSGYIHAVLFCRSRPIILSMLGIETGGLYEPYSAIYQHVIVKIKMSRLCTCDRAINMPLILNLCKCRGGRQVFVKSHPFSLW